MNRTACKYFSTEKQRVFRKIGFSVKRLIPGFAVLFIWCIPGCVHTDAQEHEHESYMEYKKHFKPLKFMGRDYWDTVGDTMVEGYKEGGSVFHFNPDTDPLIEGSAVQIVNAARYTHLPSYREYLLKNQNRPILFNSCSYDLSTAQFRTRYFANSTISDLQTSSAKDFFSSKDWLDIKEKIGNRIFGYVYSEGSWQVRPMNRKELKEGNTRKHHGISKYNLKIPETVEDYYNYYSQLFRKLQETTGTGKKLIPIAQFDNGFFVPVKLGAPASTYYVYANSNYSRRMAFARGAARQYNVPILIYFSAFVNAHYRLKGRFEMDIPYYLIPSLYWEQKALNDIARGRPFNADGWLCSLTNFQVPGEKFVGMKVSNNEVSFEGPLCGMPYSQFRNHLYFQYLCGAGFIHYEGQDWGYYDSTPSEKKPSFSYVKNGEKLLIDGWKDPMNMPVNNTSNVRKDAIDEKELVFMKELIGKDIYHTPLTLARKELVEFAQKQGRGTLYAPIAYVLDPHWALFNRNMFDEPEENYKPLEKMVFNWFTAAFEGAPLYEKDCMRSITKASQIDTAVNNYSHRREITDILTTDVSKDIMGLYPIVSTIGPISDAFKQKILEYADNGGIWFANVSQLPLEEWEKLLDIKFAGKLKGHSWQNMISGETKDESYGDYNFLKLTNSDKGICIIRDTVTGEPLVIKFPCKKGFIVLNLQEASSLNGKDCGSSWQYKYRAISYAMFSAIETLADEFLPVKVNGNIQSIYNITRDGWTVTLNNVDGVYQFLGKPATRDMSAVRNVELIFKKRPIGLKEVFSGTEIETTENALQWETNIKINPGEMKILKFKY